MSSSAMDPRLRRDDDSYGHISWRGSRSRGNDVSDFVSVRYPAASEVIRRHFHRHAIPFEDADTEAAELSRDRRENSSSVVEGHAERSARKDLGDGPFEFYQVFFGDTVLGVWACGTSDTAVEVNLSRSGRPDIDSP